MSPGVFPVRLLRERRILKKFRLFVDLDGVLADFDKGVFQAMGSHPSEVSEKLMWPVLAKTPGFYAKLDWMPQAQALWAVVQKYQPTILTGLPRGNWAEPQKRQWCARELGPTVPVICCLSREKGLAASQVLNPDETPLLIDDRLKAKESWDQIGGLFLLHTSVDQTLAALAGWGLS